MFAIKNFKEVLTGKGIVFVFLELWNIFLFNIQVLVFVLFSDFSLIRRKQFVNGRSVISSSPLYI